MLNALKLLLPALLPSWRFFDFIAPSPRIQFTLLDSEKGPPLEAHQEWCEFHPRPRKLSFLQMLGRMFWNPGWNESLFLVSCAERLLENPTQHSEDEIMKRIVRDLGSADVDAEKVTPRYLQFRLLLVQRENTEIQQAVVFHSRIQELTSRDFL